MYELTKDTPYLIFVCKVYAVWCEYFEYIEHVITGIGSHL